MAQFKFLSSSLERQFTTLRNTKSMEDIMNALSAVTRSDNKLPNQHWTDVKEAFEKFGFTFVYDRNMAILTTALFAAIARSKCAELYEPAKIVINRMAKVKKSRKSDPELVDLGQSLLEGDGKSAFDILNCGVFKKMLGELGIKDKYVNKYLNRMKKISAWRKPDSKKEMEIVAKAFAGMTDKDYGEYAVPEVTHTLKLNRKVKTGDSGQPFKDKTIDSLILKISEIFGVQQSFLPHLMDIWNKSIKSILYSDKSTVSLYVVPIRPNPGDALNAVDKDQNRISVGIRPGTLGGGPTDVSPAILQQPQLASSPIVGVRDKYDATFDYQELKDHIDRINNMARDEKGPDDKIIKEGSPDAAESAFEVVAVQYAKKITDKMEAIISGVPYAAPAPAPAPAPEKVVTDDTGEQGDDRKKLAVKNLLMLAIGDLRKKRANRVKILAKTNILINTDDPVATDEPGDSAHNYSVARLAKYTNVDKTFDATGKEHVKKTSYKDSKKTPLFVVKFNPKWLLDTYNQGVQRGVGGYGAVVDKMAQHVLDTVCGLLPPEAGYAEDNIADFKDALSNALVKVNQRLRTNIQKERMDLVDTNVDIADTLSRKPDLAWGAVETLDDNSLGAQVVYEDDRKVYSVMVSKLAVSDKALDALKQPGQDAPNDRVDLIYRLADHYAAEIENVVTQKENQPPPPQPPEDDEDKEPVSPPPPPPEDDEDNEPVSPPPQEVAEGVLRALKGEVEKQLKSKKCDVQVEFAVCDRNQMLGMGYNVYQNDDQSVLIGAKVAAAASAEGSPVPYEVVMPQPDLDALCVRREAKQPSLYDKYVALAVDTLLKLEKGDGSKSAPDVKAGAGPSSTDGAPSMRAEKAVIDDLQKHIYGNFLGNHKRGDIGFRIQTCGNDSWPEGFECCSGGMSGEKQAIGVKENAKSAGHNDSYFYDVCITQKALDDLRPSMDDAYGRWISAYEKAVCDKVRALIELKFDASEICSAIRAKYEEGRASQKGLDWVLGVAVKGQQWQQDGANPPHSVCLSNASGRITVSLLRKELEGFANNASKDVMDHHIGLYVTLLDSVIKKYMTEKTEALKNMFTVIKKFCEDDSEEGGILDVAKDRGCGVQYSSASAPESELKGAKYVCMGADKEHCVWGARAHGKDTLRVCFSNEGLDRNRASFEVNRQDTCKKYANYVSALIERFFEKAEPKPAAAAASPEDKARAEAEGKMAQMLWDIKDGKPITVSDTGLKKDEFDSGIELIREAMNAAVKDGSYRDVDGLKKDFAQNLNGLVYHTHGRPGTPQPILESHGRIPNYADIPILIGLLKQCALNDDYMKDCPDLRKCADSEEYKTFVTQRVNYQVLKISIGGMLGAKMNTMYQECGLEGLGAVSRDNPIAVSVVGARNMLKQYITVNSSELSKLLITEVVTELENYICGLPKKEAATCALALNIVLVFAEKNMKGQKLTGLRTPDFQKILESDYYKNKEWLKENPAAKQ